MQENKEYTILDLFNDTDKFNRIARNGQKILSWEDFDNQLELIREEINELYSGHENMDFVEITDGIIDSLVCIFGYMQMMEKQYNVNFTGAMKKIAENNLSKYIPGDSSVLVTETIAKYLDEGTLVTSEYNADYDVFVIRDANTCKVKKPINFVPVDITKEVLGE